MCYEIDNEHFFIEVRRRKMGPGEYKLDADAAQVATDATKQVQEAISRYQGEIRAKISRTIVAVGLAIAGLFGGVPVGMAINEAYQVEKVVERIVKVPVPAPAPKLGPMRTICPRCGAVLLLMPPTPGQTGALPDELQDPGHGRPHGPDGPLPRSPGGPVPDWPWKPSPRPVNPGSVAGPPGPAPDLPQA
jgi:hypothetical protein